MGSTTVLDDGQTVHYVDHGGDGPAVVLLHSYLMDLDMFAAQVDALGEDFRLIAVDERGFGGTPADSPFTYWDVARDVLALLDELGVERAAAAGTSQGGFIALRMALMQPERVSALVLMGTSAAAEDVEVAAGYRQLAATWKEQGPIEPLLDTVAGICLGSMDAGDWKAKWRTVPGDRFDLVLTTLVERDGLLDRLPEVRCPALVLHGSADAAYPLDHAAELVSALPNAEPLVVVEGGAHFLSLTDADAVNPHLRRFLAEHA
jgi:pimeloyl-ACP methyl ester carboxylesterase